MGDQSHTFRYEQGGCAALGGIVPHIVRNQPDGTMALADIEAAIRPDDDHAPRSRLICLENTHNRMGGVPLTVEYTDQVAELAQRRGLRLHIDGARIFNASVALGVDVKELVGGADSVTFCLSKGLAAPVGSIICGSREFIAQARRNRKILGGGMRQVGILAAAGIDRARRDGRPPRRRPRQRRSAGRGSPSCPASRSSRSTSAPTSSSSRCCGPTWTPSSCASGWTGSASRWPTWTPAGSAR